MSILLESAAVTHQQTNDTKEALQWLNAITAPIIACDFEAASKYTDEEKEEFKRQLETAGRLDKHILQQRIDSSGLSHPSLSRLTHMSLAYSETEAYVFIFDNQEIQDTVLDWIVTTPIKQVWHNLCFDGKHILHNTGKLPIDYEDSQILAKTLLNHVDNSKSATGLKHLMGYKFGAWAVSSDNFTLDNMYSPELIHYAAIDACATLTLWNEITSFLKD